MVRFAYLVLSVDEYHRWFKHGYLSQERPVKTMSHTIDFLVEWLAQNLTFQVSLYDTIF